MMHELPGFELPESVCPTCGLVINRSSPIEVGQIPQPGDIAMCVQCGHISKYDADLTLESLTNDEFSDLSDKDIRAIANLERLRHKVIITPREPFTTTRDE